MVAHNLIFTVQSPAFSDDEQAIANELAQRLQTSQGFLQEHLAYYEGEQITRHFGIAVPEKLQSIRSVVGWPRLACDAIDEKTEVQGFRLPGATEADEDLWDIWCYNGMESEAGLVTLDSLIYGRGFVLGGAGDDPGMPLLTVESPLNVAADFDARTRRVRNALQFYAYAGMEAAALYTPTSTIHLVRPFEGGAWELLARDDHNLGRPPVVMVPNRSRSDDRYGRSEITPEVMSINDAACRTVLGMEIAREFFAAPQRYILGATEDAFVDANGNSKSAWDTYIGHVLALEADEEGNTPSVGSFPTGDPTAFTAVLQDLSKRFSAVTGLPPHMVGYSADNPASAEGINAAEGRLNKKVARKQRGWSQAWSDVMVMALQLSGRPVPDAAHRIQTIWQDPSTPTPADDATFVSTLVTAGVLPAESDVSLERAGFSPTDINRIVDDREAEKADAALNALLSGGMNNGPGRPAESGPENQIGEGTSGPNPSTGTRANGS